MHRTACRNCLCLAFAGAALGAVQGAAAGPPAISALKYSADIGANIIDANTFAARKDFVLDDLADPRIREQIAGLPDTVILRDFHVESNGNVLFALDVGVTLSGIDFTPADVIRFSGSSFTREFDSVAAGVPDGVRCDGVARAGANGPLLLSFDKTFTAAGITIRPADVIAYADGAFGAKVLDAQALGLPANYNVDAVDTLGTTDYLLVSFDTGGTIGGVTFTSADIMLLHRTDGNWTRRFTMSTFSDRWNTANLDGLAAVNDDTIFQNDFQ
jgi:hypothetical protein